MSTTITTQTQTQPTPARSRIRIRTAITATVAAVIGLLGAVPAHAYTTTSSSNVAVAPTIFQVQGAHYNVGSAVTGPMYKPWVYQSGPVVNRVAGSASQTVRVTYSVDYWRGYWSFLASQSGSATIASGYVSAKEPALSMLPSTGTGYYRVRVSLTWTDAIGAVIGSMNVTMNNSGDYICSTTRTCTAGAGWVYLGA
jgi:hypothetical protein